MHIFNLHSTKKIIHVRCPSSNGMMSFWWQPLLPVLDSPTKKKTSFWWFLLTRWFYPLGHWVQKTRASELYLFRVASSGSFLPPVVTSHRIPAAQGIHVVNPPNPPTCEAQNLESISGFSGDVRDLGRYHDLTCNKSLQARLLKRRAMANTCRMRRFEKCCCGTKPERIEIIENLKQCF